MATAPPDRDPFDDVRDAFASLGTSEKAAFVFEATFETIGQALAETGRRAAAALDDLDIDSWFSTHEEAPDVGAPPPPPAAKAPPAGPTPKRSSSRKTTRKAPKKTPPAAKKTAGKPKPPKTDDDA